MSREEVWLGSSAVVEVVVSVDMSGVGASPSSARAMSDTASVASSSISPSLRIRARFSS